MCRYFAIVHNFETPGVIEDNKLEIRVATDGDTYIAKNKNWMTKGLIEYGADEEHEDEEDFWKEYPRVKIELRPGTFIEEVSYLQFIQSWNKNLYWLHDECSGWIVAAEHLQDAIDEFIDWANQYHPGLLLDEEEEQHEEFLCDHMQGGNAGQYIASINFSGEQIA